MSKCNPTLGNTSLESILNSITGGLTRYDPTTGGSRPGSTTYNTNIIDVNVDINSSVKSALDEINNVLGTNNSNTNNAEGRFSPQFRAHISNLQTRLFLKYMEIDYAFYGYFDIRYRRKGV